MSAEDTVMQVEVPGPIVQAEAPVAEYIQTANLPGVDCEGAGVLLQIGTNGNFLFLYGKHKKTGVVEAESINYKIEKTDLNAEGKIDPRFTVLRALKVKAGITSIKAEDLTTYIETKGETASGKPSRQYILKVDDLPDIKVNLDKYDGYCLGKAVKNAEGEWAVGAIPFRLFDTFYINYKENNETLLSIGFVEKYD